MGLAARLTLLLILLGMGFSGYLAASSFSGTCPLSGACPSFLGYPACFFGLGLYSLLLVSFLLAWKGVIPPRTGLQLLLLFSLLGMLFAGSLLLQEVWGGRPASICAAGFLIYLLIFLLTAGQWRSLARPASGK